MRLEGKGLRIKIVCSLVQVYRMVQLWLMLFAVSPTDLGERQNFRFDYFTRPSRRAITLLVSFMIFAVPFVISYFAAFLPAITEHSFGYLIHKIDWDKVCAETSRTLSHGEMASAWCSLCVPQ